MPLDCEKEFTSAFHEMADAVRPIALRYFRGNLAIDDKEDKTPVTKADREIESLLRDMIRKKFPSHGIIGEEYGRENENAEFVWVLDPIDGTKSFITGRPLFGTIIGLMHNAKPVVGLVDQAFTKERWVGISNISCLYNGKSVTVAPPRALSEARCYTYVEKNETDNSRALRQNVKVLMYNSDCYAYTLLAMGCTDLVTEWGLGLYDVAGLVPIVTGAGGYVSDWNGNEIALNFDGTIIAASAESLAKEAMPLLFREPSTA